MTIDETIIGKLHPQIVWQRFKNVYKSQLFLRHSENFSLSHIMSQAVFYIT